MSKLFEKATRDYEIAMSAEAKFYEDEEYADIVCYHLQQAHEKALKFLCELNGIAPQKTHNISKLLQDLDTKAVEYPIELSTVADMLSAWEATSRYSDNFTATKKQIQIAKQAFAKLQECILTML